MKQITEGDESTRGSDKSGLVECVRTRSSVRREDHVYVYIYIGDADRFLRQIATLPGDNLGVDARSGDWIFVQ